MTYGSSCRVLQSGQLFDVFATIATRIRQLPTELHTTQGCITTNQCIESYYDLYLPRYIHVATPDNRWMEEGQLNENKQHKLSFNHTQFLFLPPFFSLSLSLSLLLSISLFPTSPSVPVSLKNIKLLPKSPILEQSQLKALLVHKGSQKHSISAAATTKLRPWPHPAHSWNW